MTGVALVKYDAAITALAECVRVDEAKDWQDKAAAYQAYARQAKDDRMLSYANEIRLRAQRKAGELLARMATTGERFPKVNRPGNTRGSKNVLPKDGSDHSVRPIKLSDLDISPRQSRQWQNLAKLPSKEFEEKVAAVTKPKPKRAVKSSPTKTRKTRVAKATGNEPSLKQQVNAYHHEAVSIVSDFRDRFLSWFGAHPKLNSEQRSVLNEALQLCSSEFAKLAQAVDGR